MFFYPDVFVMDSLQFVLELTLTINDGSNLLSAVQQFRVMLTVLNAIQNEIGFLHEYVQCCRQNVAYSSSPSAFSITCDRDLRVFRVPATLFRFFVYACVV